VAVPGLLRGNTITQLDRDARLALLDVPALVSEGALSVHSTLQQADAPSTQDQDVVSCCEQTLRDATVRLQGMATEPTLSDIPLVPLDYESLRQLEQCILPSLGTCKGH